MLAGEAKALHTTKRSSGIDVSDPELAQSWASVQQDSDPQNWCAFTYAEVCCGTTMVDVDVRLVHTHVQLDLRAGTRARISITVHIARKLMA